MTPSDKGKLSLVGGAVFGLIAAVGSGLTRINGPIEFVMTSLCVAGALAAAWAGFTFLRRERQPGTYRADLAMAVALGAFVLAVVPAGALGDGVRQHLRDDVLVQRKATAADLIREIEAYRAREGAYPASLAALPHSDARDAAEAWLSYTNESEDSFSLGMDDPYADEWFSGWCWTQDAGWTRWVD